MALRTNLSRTIYAELPLTGSAKFGHSPLFKTQCVYSMNEEVTSDFVDVMDAALACCFGLMAGGWGLFA